jgi:vacuolar-type H+-ATPase catalytic subunit A/Vma1
VEVGPGLLDNIFDGIQRPLRRIAFESGDVFIPRGVSTPALDRSKAWEFDPASFKVSELVSPSSPGMFMSC